MVVTFSCFMTCEFFREKKKHRSTLKPSWMPLAEIWVKPGGRSKVSRFGILRPLGPLSCSLHCFQQDRLPATCWAQQHCCLRIKDQWEAMMSLKPWMILRGNHGKRISRIELNSSEKNVDIKKIVVRHPFSSN